METQNFSNHHRYVKGYHFVLSSLLLIGIIFAAINFYRHLHFAGLVSSALILLLFVCVTFCWWFLRTFPIKAQDRAIRSEENLRYFILTGKAIDKRITMGQIIALRFAPDEEFLPLVDKAAAENLSPKEIKQAIKAWKADHHRM
jgi:Zn-dependent protease with chaperone function